MKISYPLKTCLQLGRNYSRVRGKEGMLLSFQKISLMRLYGFTKTLKWNHTDIVLTLPSTFQTPSLETSTRLPYETDSYTMLFIESSTNTSTRSSYLTHIHAGKIKELTRLLNSYKNISIK